MGRIITTIALISGLVACASAPSGEGEAAPSGAEDREPRLVQPGAPGEATRRVEAGELDEMGGVAHTVADVRFMSGMIHHHAQALDMTALVEGRTESEALRRMALRIDISQRDEIDLMERWLASRGEEVPDWSGVPHEQDHGPGADDRAPAIHDRPMMPGMLTPDQMERLASARGETFDRLFLESMIQHHQGAIVMVDELFSSAGGGEESEVFQLASHVEADQVAEIQRMRGLLEAMR